MSRLLTGRNIVWTNLQIFKITIKQRLKKIKIKIPDGIQDNFWNVF
jgi:hypothetical protein